MFKMSQSHGTKFQILYKRNVNYEERRSVRAKFKEKERRKSRQTIFGNNRNIDQDLVKHATDGLKGDNRETEKPSRRMQFMIWKQEKERQRMAEREKRAKEKPPFKCGVVHYKPSPVEYYSMSNPRRSGRNKINTSKAATTSFLPQKHDFKPPKNVLPIKLVQHAMNDAVSEQPNRRVTRSVTKWNDVQPRKSTRKMNNNVSLPGNSNTKNVINTSTLVRQSIVESSPSPVDTVLCEEQKDDKTAPLSYIYPVNLSPSVDTVLCEEQKDDKTAPISYIYPVNLSSFVSPDRGSGRRKKTTPSINKTHDSIKVASGNLRKLVGVRFIQEMLNTPEAIEKEEKNVFSSNVDSVVLQDEKTQNVQHLRELYDEEMKRLGGMCLVWDALLAHTNSQEIPHEIQDSIRIAVGQTRLLMRKKLAQFKCLVDESEHCNANRLNEITCTDLKGFWDLVSIQINDVDIKFNQLKTLQDANWIPEPKVEDTSEKRKLRVRNVNKNVQKAKKSNNGKKSAFQTYLAEQKKKNIVAEKKEIENHSICSFSSPFNMNTSIRSILKSEKRRGSGKLSHYINVHQGGSPSLLSTPRRVTFKDDLAGVENRGNKVRVTPHFRRIKGISRQSDHSASQLQNETPPSCTSQPDLINWDSPSKEILTVRQSPRTKELYQLKK